MSWQVLIAISITFYSVSTLLQKIILRHEKTDAMAFSIFFQLLVGVIIGAFGFVTTDMSLPNLFAYLPNLLIMTILYTGGNIFLFKSLQKIDASIFTVIFSARNLFTIFASTIFLNEGLNFHQFWGMGLILVAIILISLKSTKLTFSRAEFFALLAALGFGLALTNDRILLSHFNLYPYVFLAFVIPALVTIPLYPKSAAQMGVFLKAPFVAKIFLLCVLYAVSAITFFQALQIGSNSSQIVSVNQVNVVLTVILSAVILKERTDLVKKVFASILSFAGLILLG